MIQAASAIAAAGAPLPQDAMIGTLAGARTTHAVGAVQNPAEAIGQVRDRASELTGLISVADIAWAVVVLVATYYLIKLISFVLGALSSRNPRYRPQMLQLVAVTRLGLWVLATYVIVAGIIQPDPSSLVALFAAGGLGIGFAAQDILKNLFGGFVILLDRPFQVGDLIDIGPHHGEVISIGLRATLLRTRDDTVVAVPNAEVVSQPVLNANSGALDCMVVTEFHLPAFADPVRIREIATEAALTSPFVFAQKPVTVQVLDTVGGNRFVTRVKVRAYVYDHRLETEFAADVAERAKRAFLRAGLIAEDDVGGLKRLGAPAGAAGRDA